MTDIETIKYIAPGEPTVRGLTPQSYAPLPRRKRVAGGRPVLVQTRLTMEQAEKLDRFAKVYGVQPSPEAPDGMPLTHAAALALVLDKVEVND